VEVETRNCFSAKVFRLPRCQTRIILVLPAPGSCSRCSRFQASARSLNPRKINRTYSFAKRGGKRRGNRVTYMQRRDEHTGKGGRDCDHHSRWKIVVGFARGIYSPTARNKAISPQLVNFAFVREVASWSHLIRNPPQVQQVVAEYTLHRSGLVWNNFQYDNYAVQSSGCVEKCRQKYRITRRIARVFTRLVLKIQKFAYRCILI